MRLTCPNCDARYEVPDEVMPASGRDVQCSNCGQTWFQHHPDHLPEPEPDLAPEPLEEMEVVEVDDTPAPAAPPSSEPRTPPAPPPEPKPEPEAPPRPPRRELDPAVAEILREEAEAERAARRRPPSDPLESQPDLGLETRQDEKTQRTLEARRRMALMRGEPDPLGPEQTASRRDLLPDIEEINSSLRTDDGRSNTVAADTGVELDVPSEPRTSGFRTGFLLVVLLVALAALLYVFAADIAVTLPALAPTLDAYTAAVDNLRLWADTQLRSLLTWLDALASRSGT